jgi:hypothetical protein
MAEVNDAPIGVLTRQYSESRRRRAAIVAELASDCAEIERFTSTMRQFQADGWTATSVPYLPDGYPEGARLKGMLTDLRLAMTALDQARGQLKELGIELP